MNFSEGRQGGCGRTPAPPLNPPLVKYSEIQLYAQWYSCYRLTLSASRTFQLFINIRRQMSIIQIYVCKSNRNIETIYNNSLYVHTCTYTKLYWPHRSLLHTTKILYNIHAPLAELFTRGPSSDRSSHRLPAKWSTFMPASLIATLLLTSNSCPVNHD